MSGKSSAQSPNMVVPFSCSCMGALEYILLLSPRVELCFVVVQTDGQKEPGGMGEFGDF